LEQIKIKEAFMMRMVKKSFGLVGIFLTLAISAYAGGTYEGDFTDLKNGYSKIDVTGDRKPELVFIKKGKLPGTLSKLVITDTQGKLLFYLSPLGEFTSEEDLDRWIKDMEESYQRRISHPTDHPTPTSLDIPAQVLEKFKTEHPIEKKMVKGWKETYLLIKEGWIKGEVFGPDFIAYSGFNANKSLMLLEFYYVNESGERASEDLIFGWDPKLKKFKNVCP